MPRLRVPPAGFGICTRRTVAARGIATSKQLIFDLPPACAKNARQSADSDAVHAGCSCVAHHCEQRRFYIRRVTAGFVAEPDLHIAGSHWSSRSPNRRAGIDHAPSDADWQLTVPIGTHRTDDKYTGGAHSRNRVIDDRLQECQGIRYGVKKMTENSCAMKLRVLGWPSGLRDLVGCNSLVLCEDNGRDSMAWTEITRGKCRREGLRYVSDTTDAEWALIRAAHSVSIDPR